MQQHHLLKEELHKSLETNKKKREEITKLNEKLMNYAEENNEMKMDRNRQSILIKQLSVSKNI